MCPERTLRPDFPFFHSVCVRSNSERKLRVPLYDSLVPTQAIVNIIIQIVYIYHALINALSAHIIHINLNIIFCTLNMVVDVHRNRKAYWGGGGGGYGGGGRGRLYTYCCTVTTRMIPGLRWAATRAILMFQ